MIIQVPGGPNISLILPSVYSLLQILALTGLGFLLSRYWGWSREFFGGLNRFLVKIVLPLYFFVKISQTDPADLRASLLFPLAAAVALVFGVCTSWLLVSLLPMSGRDRRVSIAMAGFGNSGIIPLMLIEILPVTLPRVAERFGTAAPTLFVGAYLLFLTPMLWSFGNYLVSGKQHKLRLKELVTPPLIGIMAGFLFLIPPLQDLLLNPTLPFFHVHSALAMLGRGAYPLILVCLGSMIAGLRGRVRKDHLMVAASVAGIRFLLLPALFFAAYYLFLRKMDLPGEVIWVLFLETHLPPATSLVVMARSETQSLVSFGLLFTYLCYMVVLPIYLLLFLSLPGLF
ncbi:MAG: transporter [Spirochaeta sp.]|nr:transporter [Spirochaeta sp.]